MSLKILTCSLGAIALTAVMSSAFIDVMPTVRGVAARQSIQAVAVVDEAKDRLLRAILPRFTG